MTTLTDKNIFPCKQKTYSLTIFYKLITVVLFCSLFFSVNAHAVVYVNIDASGNNDGSDWQHAYNDLQTALTNTSNDEIWIASGIYTPAPANGDINATFNLSNGIALYGGFNGTEVNREQRNPQTNVTVLSGDLNNDDIYRYLNHHDGWYFNTANSQHVVTTQHTDESVIIDGLTISHGRTASTYTNGAGLYIIEGSPTITNVIFYGNGASHGGAVYINDGNPKFINCTFKSNHADLGQGGAIYISTTYGKNESHLEIKNSYFTRNAAVGSSINTGDGGAVFVGLFTTAKISGSTFFDNLSGHRTYSSGDSTRGGAITTYGEMTIIDSSFMQNKSHWGGALYSYNNLTLINSVFSRNLAYTQVSDGLFFAPGGYGGALFINGNNNPLITLSGVSISNNKATKNAAGLFIINASSASVTTVNINNSIVWGNDVLKFIDPKEDPIPIFKTQIQASKNSNVNISYSNVQGLFENVPGEDPTDQANFPGSIDSEPFFVDASADNLRLSQASPSIDAAANNLIPAGILTDLDNNARRFDDPVTADSGNGTAPIVDMGAYEFASVPLDQAPPLPAEPEPAPVPDPVPTTGTDVEMVGLITAVNPDSVVIDGITIIINTETIVKFDDDTGDAFASGQTAELKGMLNIDGSVTASKIQITP